MELDYYKGSVFDLIKDRIQSQETEIKKVKRHD
jgi:hypothetical protein